MVGQIVLLTMYLPVCVVIIFALIQSKKIKINKTMTQESFTVMFSDIFVMLGILLDILAFIVLGGFTLFAPDTIDWISGTIFGFSFCLGAYGIILGKTFKVIVKGNEITVHKAFRKPYTFTFSDITLAVRTVNKNQLKTEDIMIRTSTGKRFSIANLEISYERFMNKIQEKVNKKYLSGFELNNK